MLHPELSAEVARRRTFAIISHPDAGKTTLTEKLLLYGGAIRQAGSVKARKAARHATSDWMEIEKQRGISVTSSAMQFDFDGFRINILDTPGHQDFSEDTYRTLVAADSAVMLIDNAKGVEEQTIKLFKVCRMRSIPIFTFVNKLDRAGRDPFELMEELENVLGIRSCPVNWPIGIHGDFQGVYHRDTRVVELYRGGDHGQKQVEVETIALDDPRLPGAIGQSYYDKLLEDVELLDVAGDPFDLEHDPRGQAHPHVLRLGEQQLRRGAVFEALPLLHEVAHAARFRPRPHRADGREVHRLHLQDTGQHEPRAPRPAGVHARVFRRI